MRVLPFACLIVFLISGCSKTPESQTAVDIGKQPKQIIDKVTSDVDKAMRKAAEQRQEAEKKE
jgi:PBP1b-binding outer membrane lipoprotein LpoB